MRAAIVCLMLAACFSAGGAEGLSPSGFTGRITVVHFWATWCKPCVRELPVLAETARRFGDQGVRVVGISVDEIENGEDRERVEAFARRHGADFELRTGGTVRDMEAFGVGPGIPATVVVDEQGQVVARFSGEVTLRRLSRTLRRVLRGESLGAEAEPHGHAEDHDHGEPHAHDPEHGHGDGDGHGHGDEHTGAEAAASGEPAGAEAALVPS